MNELENIKCAPTRKEVVHEMLSDAKRLTRKIGSKTINTSASFIYCGVAGFVGALSFPYIVPSLAIYDAKDNEKKHPIINRVGDLGIYTGIIIGLIADVVGYGYLVYNDHPEVLAIPATTNAISGIYEWYNHTRRKIIEGKDSVSRLENKI